MEQQGDGDDERQREEHVPPGLTPSGNLERTAAVKQNNTRTTVTKEQSMSTRAGLYTKVMTSRRRKRLSAFMKEYDLGEI